MGIIGLDKKDSYRAKLGDYYVINCSANDISKNTVKFYTMTRISLINKNFKKIVSFTSCVRIKSEYVEPLKS